MTGLPVKQATFLETFQSWADGHRESLLSSDQPDTTPLEQELTQSDVFMADLKGHVHTLTTQTKYEVASLAQCIAALALSPFAIFADLYRLSRKSINASTVLKNIVVIPIHIGLSILKLAFFTLRSVNKAVTAASIGIGFLAWHGGERLVRLFTGNPHTVLSSNRKIRDIVYHSIGLTMLAAAAVFVPVASIQMIALPIIIGSIYGTINNQFTVRKCPEYYTMGHYYDGTDLKGHAIKTNNTIIKPIVTGCYATTMVTKLAGLILAGAGALPYTSAALPIPYAGAMIAGVTVISLVAGHIYSKMKERSIQKSLNEFAALCGIQLNETLLNMKWEEFVNAVAEQIKQKRSEALEISQEELAKFDKKLLHLINDIESNILDANLPMKYIAGWQANNSRNTVGYLAAGGGTLAVAVSTIFLRIFAL